MAAKIHGTSSAANRLTISSLSELSRGEFDMSHISEMETIILQTLAWNLHPPTAQCFINSFYKYLPVPSNVPVSIAIYQRAIFFAELVLYDYAFVTRKRSLIALACMLNAMEGMDESTVPQEQQRNFVDTICGNFDLRFTKDEIESVRNRLWYVYSMSAQYKEDDMAAAAATITSSDVVMKDARSKKQHYDGKERSPSSSPVSVTATVQVQQVHLQQYHRHH
jgi:hypothetical protein